MFDFNDLIFAENNVEVFPEDSLVSEFSSDIVPFKYKDNNCLTPKSTLLKKSYVQVAGLFN